MNTETKEEKGMTKEKALWITHELFQWLSDDTTRMKHRWPGWEKYGAMHNYCALCEYNSQHNLHCISRCILPVFAASEGCCNPIYKIGGPYTRWRNRLSPAPVRAEAARVISRDALDEYNRLKEVNDVY